MLLLAAALAIAAPDPSREQEASRRFAELIDDAANAGEFDSALRLVDEAQRLYPHARWTFFRASILAEKGDCKAAVPHYRSYIATEESEANRSSAQAGLEACQRELASTPTPPPPTPTVAADRPPPTNSGHRADKPRPWHRDPAGIALLATGLAVVGAGAVLYIQAARGVRSAENADSLDTFESRMQRSRALGSAGIAGFAIGAALVTGGAIRFGLVARSRRSTP